ncbi:MAG: DoxX-like family protein [Opitutales bacterium]
MERVVRWFAAGVWLFFGLGLKVFGLDPRHEAIVATVVGAQWAGPLTLAVGIAETLLAIWILTARWPLLCAAVQTVAIVSMNTLEILRASHILYSPVLMVSANTVFLSLVWWAALHRHRKI